jgi:hypothetical protein
MCLVRIRIRIRIINKVTFENLCPEYLIPDTIIIKQRRPYAWLTANNSHVIRKGKIDELKPQFIFDGMCAAYRRKDVLHSHTVLAYLLN